MKKKKLLIIAPYQFGELSDCYYWAKYAIIEGWDVTYIGYKYKHRDIKERKYPKVKVKSVFHYNNRNLLGVMFYLKCIFEILIHRHQNVIICRMPMCQILPKIFQTRNIILDVRTLSVSKNATERECQNNSLRELKKLFHKCSVISEGVGIKIGTPFELLPLGSEALSDTKKVFDKMRLFYIGTFDNRDIPTFIRGLAKFQQQTDNELTFDIIGGGSDEEVNALTNTIESTNVRGVTMHGYLTHDDAVPFFDKCNIGVCYIPVTEYYQYQPPTKLYEYLLSGMAAISTNTISNLEVMRDNNGVVVSDNEESVCEGLKVLASKMNKFNSDTIIGQSQSYHWKNIVKNNLLKLAE